jgi:hypothetical protein
MMGKLAKYLLVAGLFISLILVSCREQYLTWLLVEPGGQSSCGNGSPYRFFVNYSPISDNVLVYFEAGGACWDYPSCSGEEGVRGAANPNGIPEDYMQGIPAVMSPFVLRNHPWDRVPTFYWNIVFIPYCTGDVHTGNRQVTYTDQENGEELVWHHAGHANVLAVIDWMKEKFPRIPKLMVTGCSAGGIGALANYYFLRENLNVGQAVLLNDSGPAYLTGEMLTSPNELVYKPHSKPLHNKIREAWNLDPVLAEFPESFNPDDFGSMNLMISALYPDDRIAHTQFSMDQNYSSYSYERFYEDIDVETMLEYWADDQANLMDLYDGLYYPSENTGYFIPYFRPFNESHCTCILDFTDTDITGTGMDMKDYIVKLLDFNAPLESHYEAPDPDELNRPYWGWELIELLLELL